MWEVDQGDTELFGTSDLFGSAMGAQMLEASFLGIGQMLRLGRDAWSIVKLLIIITSFLFVTL